MKTQDATPKPPLDSKGHEIPDDSPVAIPVRFNRIPNMMDQMRTLIRAEVSRAAEAEGYETFEEADDFDIGDDYEPNSRYELDEDTLNYDHTRDTRGPNGSESSDRDNSPGTETPFQQSEQEHSSDGTGSEPDKSTPRDTPSRGRKPKETKSK